MSISSIPQPLLRKLLFAPLLGCGCFAIGIAAFFATTDRTLLVLSGVLLGGSAFRTFQLYQIISCKKYEVLTGTCVATLPRIPGRPRSIRLLSDNGAEIALRLPKQYRLRVGAHYRLYFAEREGLSLEDMQHTPFSDTLILDSFLGCEEKT